MILGDIYGCWFIVARTKGVWFFFLNGEGTFIFYRFGVVLLINETRDYLWEVKIGRNLWGKEENKFKISAQLQNFDDFGKLFRSRQNTYATANMHKSEITHFLLIC